ncbi:hypothetical protein BaRGS_00000692 [Batillaria attramentaria]|uniref:Uncharacterized protein n=1 Tax=Batillaria attramentaria TaxID=370345 RepID=A0ABD0M870_9CAEN
MAPELELDVDVGRPFPWLPLDVYRNLTAGNDVTTTRAMNTLTSSWLSNRCSVNPCTPGQLKMQQSL